MGKTSPHLRSLLTRALLEKQIQKLATENPISIGEDKPVMEAIKLLKDNSIGSVLVKDSAGALAGILTEQDVIRRVSHSGSEAVKDFMTTDPETIDPHTSVARALYIMAQGRYRHLPLVSGKEFPTAIVSVRDTVHYIFSLMEKADSDEYQEGFLNAEALTAFLDSPVSSLVDAPCTTASESDTVKSVLELMQQKQVGSLVIVSDKQKLVGIFTERDLIKKLSDTPDYQSHPIGEAMTAEPKVVRAGSTIKHCVRLMHDGGFRHLPIVDRDDKPLHMLSIRNFITAFGYCVVEDINAEHQD